MNPLEKNLVCGGPKGPKRTQAGVARLLGIPNQQTVASDESRALCKLRGPLGRLLSSLGLSCNDPEVAQALSDAFEISAARAELRRLEQLQLDGKLIIEP